MTNPHGGNLSTTAYHMLLIAAMMPLTVLLALGPVSRASAAGIAGPDQTIAEGLPVLLGDPAKTGTDPGDTDPGAAYRWRQIILDTEPYVKLSHIDKTTTMFIAPEVPRDTRFRFGLKRNAESEVTVDVTVIHLSADDPTNATFIDHMITTPTCDTYDPATRGCGSGHYKAQKTTFQTPWYPLPLPGRRYVWRAGTYSYSKKPGGTCQPSVTPVVRIEGTNAAVGTATNPIQFKVYKDGASYEHVLLEMGGVTDCAIAVMFHVGSGSRYVIAEGFEITGNRHPGTAGSLVVVGGFGWGGGGINHRVGPADHVTIRHFNVHDNGGLGHTNGLFRIGGPSHDVAFQYIQAYNGSSGMAFGISHGLDRRLMPYNIFVHTAAIHSNNQNTGNSGGYVLTGARNTSCYRCVAYLNPDGGFITQGPYVDSNVWWDSVAFNATSDQSPFLTRANYGNERGVQVGTMNPGYGIGTHCQPGHKPGLGCFRSAAFNRFYRVASFDNMGNGFNDVSGAVDTRAYHLTVFNNCRRRSNLSGYAGIIAESYAGTGRWPASPGPGLTLANSASYWHRANGCQNAGPTVSNIFVSHLVASYTTLVTNLSTDPRFVVRTPLAVSHDVDAPESGVTVDVAVYSNAAARVLNASFGTVTGLALKDGSPAIDKGTFIGGVHCDRADDAADPYPAADPNCIHWRGAAPDIGAYEHPPAKASSVR